MAALPNSPLIPVEEYLNTAYDPDVEFVDGVLVERTGGDWLHSLIQSNVLFALRRKGYGAMYQRQQHTIPLAGRLRGTVRSNNEVLTGCRVPGGGSALRGRRDERRNRKAQGIRQQKRAEYLADRSSS